MKSRSLALATLLLALAACSDAQGPDVVPAVTVMTRNLYIGFDADAVIAALSTGDPAIFGPVVQEAVATLGKTDFSVRAAAIVDEIAADRPHVVGLQEAYLLHADLTGLGVPDTIDLDYLAIMEAAIASAQLPYKVIARLVDTHMQPLPGVELLDREALLIDTTRVALAGTMRTKTFDANIGVLAPGVDKKAGYIMAPLTIDGVPVNVVTTHLEADVGPGSYDMVAALRALQAAEIDSTIADQVATRSIVMGDLNDDPGSAMVAALTTFGFVDVWGTLRGGEPGYTASCFAHADLSDAVAACTRRIDYVFARGFSSPAAALAGDVLLVGVDPAARRAGPAGMIWPSDHAGLAATLEVR